MEVPYAADFDFFDVGLFKDRGGRPIILAGIKPLLKLLTSTYLGRYVSHPSVLSSHDKLACCQKYIGHVFLVVK